LITGKGKPEAEVVGTRMQKKIEARAKKGKEPKQARKSSKQTPNRRYEDDTTLKVLLS
jgi:hypothetical protein